MLYVICYEKKIISKIKDERGRGGGGRWRGERGKTKMCDKGVLLVKQHNILEIYLIWNQTYF